MPMTNGENPPRTVALLNQKGGVGKTTTTANLGHAFAIAGKRVCLIDLDPQGHLTLHLGIESDAVERTVYDLMVDPDADAADCIIREARPNLDVMLAEVDLAGAETELAHLPNRRTILRDRFAPLADRYDVILIDCPPSLGLLTVNALTMADELFVPMQAHFLALQGVGRLLETVRLVCSSVNAELTVAGVILCMFERQTTLAKEILADLEDFFDRYREADVPWADCRVLQPPIRRNIKLAEAPSFGNTIFDYAPWCPGAIDYRRLAAALLERWGQAVEGFAPTDADEEREEGAVAVEPPAGPRSVSVGPGSRGATSVAPPPAADDSVMADSPAGSEMARAAIAREHEVVGETGPSFSVASNSGDEPSAGASTPAGRAEPPLVEVEPSGPRSDAAETHAPDRRTDATASARLAVASAVAAALGDRAGFQPSRSSGSDSAESPEPAGSSESPGSPGQPDAAGPPSP